MSDRQDTNPGFITPDLNAQRVYQLQRDVDKLERVVSTLEHTIGTINTTLIEHVVEFRQIKESRTNQGKRLGVVEGSVNELLTMKKLLAVVGTIGLIGIGAYLKALFGG